QRREGALRVIEVVEHDRGERHDPQVPEARNRLGVAVELPLTQTAQEPTGVRNWCLCRGHRHGRPPLAFTTCHPISGALALELPPESSEAGPRTYTDGMTAMADEPGPKGTSLARSRRDLRPYRHLPLSATICMVRTARVRR